MLVFYILGLTINNVGLRNVQADMQSAQQTHIRYAAGQIEQDYERLRFFMLEMMSDKALLRYDQNELLVPQAHRHFPPIPTGTGKSERRQTRRKNILLLDNTSLRVYYFFSG